MRKKVILSEMHTLHLFSCFLCLLLLAESSTTISSESEVCPPWVIRGGRVSVGVVIDESSRVGKEQKIAMKMAVRDLRHCLNLVLHVKDLHGNSALAASAGMNFFDSSPTNLSINAFLFISLKVLRLKYNIQMREMFDDIFYFLFLRIA